MLTTSYIFKWLSSYNIFTWHSFKQSERTRIDKVRRLLDDLVRRGPDAYERFLDVLKKTGYDFLANLIKQNEEILRREKDPSSSMPIQATSQTQGEIHPASRAWSRNITATQSSFVGSQNSNSNSSSMESFGSSSMLHSRSSESSLPLSRSEPSRLNPQLREMGKCQVANRISTIKSSVKELRYIIKKNVFLKFFDWVDDKVPLKEFKFLWMAVIETLWPWSFSWLDMKSRSCRFTRHDEG